ncbi:hypothetical protein BFP72_00370 [Reichenbachiella sp. 5M10]|uniref:hypothetical protein n=1 Tax=Reichenbachiella sp. 5M10 TaxID=1889772 RepID=UPI000C14F346|nr:hypothetical protein [Reichenbachiella sp. 5M10]PIB33993.1 hypothetical protein BFP72_00370 [Reichenbachiella sp. 5M10]
MTFRIPSSKLPLRQLTFLLSWFLFVFVLAPILIDYLYLEATPAFVADLLAKYPVATLAYVHDQWFDIAMASSLAFALIVGLGFYLRSDSFEAKVLGKTTPQALGAIRMLICLILLLNVLWEDLPSTAYIPREMSKPIGIMNLFMLIPGFGAFLENPVLLLLFQMTTAVLLFLGMIGLHTKKVLPFAALGYLIFAGLFRQYSWFYHTGLIPLFTLIVLSLSPAADGWSVDNFIKIWRSGSASDTTASTRYAWSRYAIWMVIAIPYVGAGLSKVRNGGLLWWDAVNFKHIMFYSTLRPMEFDFEWALFFVNAPDYIIEVMALSAILGEILYGSVLFSKRARIILPATMFLMHVGILFLQNILFYDLILLQLVFWDFTKFRQAISTRLNAKYDRLQFGYDASSDFWRRTVLVLTSMDIFDRVSFVKTLRTSDSLPKSDYRGQKHTGISAVLSIAHVLPALWVFVPILYLGSKFPSIHASLVQYLSQKYHNIPNTQALQPTTSWATTPKLCLVILTILGVSWAFKLEVYPLTAMQMFSRVRDNVVQYELVYAEFASGEQQRAPIEKSIGAMSDGRYRRVIKMAFDDKKKVRCEKFLRSCTDRWNERVSEEEKIIGMKVEQWEWDFIGDKDNPNHGSLLNTVHFDFP